MPAFFTSSIEAVLFDFDGTLTRSEALDFDLIKQEVGCPADQPVLEFIRSMAGENQRTAAMAALDRFEMEAAIHSQPNNGAAGLIGYLKSIAMPLGILSRNRKRSILRALENIPGLTADDFKVILSRDDDLPPKPDPAGVITAARKLEVDVQRLLIVGDYWFDILAGKKAGARTALLGRPKTAPPKIKVDPDIQIERLDQLIDPIRHSRPLPAGKFPNDLLQDYFSEFDFSDPSVIINPGIGEDTAAVNIEDEEVLILKSDPITFATDAVGQYAVLINANDIATSGADPRWLLITLLFPVGITAGEAFAVLDDLRGACGKWGITLCGGHTEITDAVTRTVVSGTLAGTVKRKGLIEKHGMRAGDALFLTKGVAVEGTSIIAHEFGDTLAGHGFTPEEITTAKDFLHQLSILEEARIARDVDGVSAMHDVTEGGLASAALELSIAGGRELLIDMEKIPVFPQTERICRALGIDPLGLIGSGSLLISCRPESASGLAHKIRSVGIDITQIGRATAAGSGIKARYRGKEVKWPVFSVDEITRLF